jgi:hypothetical protein
VRDRGTARETRSRPQPGARADGDRKASDARLTDVGRPSDSVVLDAELGLERE